MLIPSTCLRLETQLDVVPLLLNGSRPEIVMARPASGQWSAHEHLAHLACHHAVFLERLQQILHEHRPPLGRYRAEEDPAWPEWSRLSTEEVFGRLTAQRADIVQLIKGLSEAQTSRVGVHSLFGDMSLAHWVEFFLLHEAHHLYTVMIRLGQATQALRLEQAP